MKRKFTVGLLAVVLVGLGVAAFVLLRPRPVRVALVNMPSFMVGRMMLAVDRENVELVNEQECAKLAGYDAVIAFGMGLHWTDEDREQVRALDAKHIPYMVMMPTTPDNELNSIDSAKRSVLIAYLLGGGTSNFRSGFNYLRQEVLGKSLRTGTIEEPIRYAGDLLFAKNEEDRAFSSVAEFQEYYKDHGYKEGAPKVALLTGMIGPFNANRDFLDSIIVGLESAGMNVYPMSTGEKRIEFLREVSPDVVLYFPHGRIAAGRSAEAEAWFKERNIPLMAPLLLVAEYDQWMADPQGLFGGILSQSVVTPEIDGAIEPYAIVAMEERPDGLKLFQAIRDRLPVFCNMVRKYVDLKRKPNAEKRLAIFYYKGPGQNTLVAQGIEVVPSLYNVLKHLQSEGYNVDGLPATVEEFQQQLMERAPLFNSYAEGKISGFLTSGYPAFIQADSLDAWLHRTLTPSQYDSVVRKNGAVPGRFNVVESEGKEQLAVARISYGNVVLMPQPGVGGGENDFNMVHGSVPVPSYIYMGAYMWARNAFGADAIMHFGTHGSLEFIHGKQVALSSNDFTDRLVYDLPHMYYYTTANIGEAIIAKRRSYAQTISYLAPPFMNTDLEGEVAEIVRAGEQYMAKEQDDDALGAKIKRMAVKAGYHRDLKLDSNLSVPFKRDEVEMLLDFVQELAAAKIPGGMYVTGVPFIPAKIESSVELLSIDPVAYALSQVDVVRGKVTERQIRKEAFYTANYINRASRIVKKLRATRSTTLEKNLQLLGISPKEWALYQSYVAYRQRMAERSKGMMGMMGGMPSGMGGKPMGMPSGAMGMGKPSGQGAPMGGMASAQGVDTAKKADGKSGASASGKKRADGKSGASASKKGAGAQGSASVDQAASPKAAGSGSMAMPRGSMPSGAPMGGMAQMSAGDNAEEFTPEQVQLCEALAVLESAVNKMGFYEQALLTSPKLELASTANAFSGGYTAPSPGGDYIASPAVLPTGRNLYSIDPERTPTTKAWENGKVLGDALIADYRKRHNDSLPRKVSFTLWSSSFIESEGSTVAEILYMLGVEPVRDRMGRVQDVRLIPMEELGRPRIDVVVQTSGQLRDIAASRLFLIQKAVELVASNKEEDETSNFVLTGIKEAEALLLEKGVPPAMARNLATARVFGGLNGAYGTGIQPMVEAGDRWEERSQIADVYLNNMGAIYGAHEQWGDFTKGLFEAALKRTDVVVQPRQSNSWGALSLDHVYEFMGGLSLAVERVTGKDPEAYFTDLRNRYRVRTQELKQAIGVEARTTLLNPKYVGEFIKEGAGAADGISETLLNTYAWNVMKPSVIDNELWDALYDMYVLDNQHLGTVEFFERVNPAALQGYTAAMMETIRKGFWKATPEQRARIAELHAQSVAKSGAGCSGMVCDNKPLREFIGQQLSNNDLSAQYEKAVEDVRTAKEVVDNHNAKVLKKEELSLQRNSNKVSTDNIVWIAVGVAALLVIAFVLIRRRNRHAA